MLEKGHSSYLSKDNMLAIEPRGISQCNEELQERVKLESLQKITLAENLSVLPARNLASPELLLTLCISNKRRIVILSHVSTQAERVRNCSLLPLPPCIRCISSLLKEASS